MTSGYVADACAVIGFLAAEKLSPRVISIIANADAAISPVTVWEMTRKAIGGNLPAQWGAEGLAAYLHDQGFPILPLTWEDAERASHLPPHHKDPMDRMLIAQALARDLTILTSDRIFAAYGVKTLW